MEMRPDAKPSNPVVTDELVEFVADLLVHRVRKGQIKRLVYDVIGGRCSRETIEKLLNKARAVITEDAGLDKAEERAEAIGFLKATIADPEVSTVEKLKAQEQLSKIIGIGPYGQTTDTDDLNKYARLKAALDQIENAKAD